MLNLTQHTPEINRLLSRYGVKFGIYKNQTFHEQLFPFDAIPRIISCEEFALLERGLIQRVDALNLFLADIYHEKRIVRDGVLPSEFLYASKGYLPECEGISPPADIYSHISGIDLVQAQDKSWYILEDNLRIPSGASYPLIARDLCRRASPETYHQNDIVDNRNYADLLRETMDFVSAPGMRVILTPGRYNAAYFEHSYLAERTGSALASNSDLYVEDNKVYYRDYRGESRRVGVIYRRLSDEYLDPLTFLPESLIGVPGLMSAYRAGNVAIVNAPGNGAADDKGIYYFVPKMIKYYLDQDPILENAPAYLPLRRGVRPRSYEGEAGGSASHHPARSPALHRPGGHRFHRPARDGRRPHRPAQGRPARLRALGPGDPGVGQRPDPLLAAGGFLRRQFFSGRRL